LLAAVPITYETSVPPGGHGELDTPAVWVAPDPAASMLLVTDKTEDFIEIHNANSNTYLGRLGGSGSGPGQLSRPNAVTVAYGVPTTAGPRDVAFVVERDNHRVSAFYLPYGFHLGAIGTADLQEPMGIALHWDGPTLQLWVTDIGTSPQRIVVFDVMPSPTGLAGVVRFSFNAPPSSVLESIAVDGANHRVIVADEGSFDVMIFDLQGNFLHRIGTGRFTDDPEGIAIYDTGNGTGYVMITDQVQSPTTWEVFHRQSLHFLLSWNGPTQGTDGIALVQQPLPNFPQGSFFAVHQDRAVHAYDWRDIGAATGMCVEAGCTPSAAWDPVRRSAIVPFPTPFGGRGTMQFHLPAPAAADIAVYDLRGARVVQLDGALRPAGWHAITWDGHDRHGRPLPSGIYFVRTRLGGATHAHKLTLLR
jgi:3-phytase